ncbi:MAG: hypothetical protein ACRDBG_26025 [Waterburya sp.]
MTGFFPDKYISPITTFDENCSFSASGSNTTSIGGLGTGALILGATGKETQILGNLSRVSTDVPRLVATRTTTPQVLSPVNTDINLIWNGGVEQVGLTLNTTTGTITIPKAGFYFVSASVNIQSASANLYAALGYSSPLAITNSSFVSVFFQAAANRPTAVDFAEIVYFSGATTLNITARVSAVSNFLSITTSGSYATNRLSITHLF